MATITSNPTNTAQMLICAQMGTPRRAVMFVFSVITFSNTLVEVGEGDYLRFFNSSSKRAMYSSLGASPADPEAVEAAAGRVHARMARKRRNAPVRMMRGGRTYTSQLSPVRGGSASTRAPYCSTKYCLICSSVQPSESFWRISSRHWRQASVGQTSNGVFSQTGQYN